VEARVAEALKANTALQIADPVELAVRGSEVVLRTASGSMKADREVLAMLAAFRGPRRLDQALDALTRDTACRLDWAATAARVLELCDAGVLEAVGAAVRPALGGRGFDSAASQVRLLGDRVRTLAFVDAVRAAVRPGDVVVDLGTGTGVLAVAAAQAGARRVHAIERGSVGRLAAALFAQHGLADRIELVASSSTTAVLPEPADVLVSEIIGDEPFGENVLEYTRDALGRLLRPGARLVPRRLRLYARAVTLDDATVEAHAFSPARLAEWSRWYGMDLAALAGARSSAPYRFFVDQARARAWAPRSEAALLADVDLRNAPAHLDAVSELRATSAGRLDALVESFDVELDAQRTLRVDPWSGYEGCHWRACVWLLDPRTTVEAGASLALRYRYGVAGASLGAEAQAQLG
jgi:precorrin-6B methylase 2